MAIQRFNIFNLLLAALLMFTGVACDKQQTFQVKGVIREVVLEKKSVKIDHEKIPGYMDAMTMDFDVKNAKELVGLQPGDTVSFRMIVTAKDGWIDQVKKLASGTPIVANAPDTFRRVREVEPLKVGDLMPEYHFTNEQGQAVSLSDFKGKAVAFTFIFTRCPFPTFCPRMSDNFGETQKKLAADPSAPKNWQLLSITFDPAFDTPVVLKNYARRFKADPQHWNFLTGELIDITAITEQFGLLFWRPDPKEVTGINHNLRTVVLDTEGRIQKVFTENKWTATDLAAEIVKAAQKGKS